MLWWYRLHRMCCHKGIHRDNWPDFLFEIERIRSNILLRMDNQFVEFWIDWGNSFHNHRDCHMRECIFRVSTSFDRYIYSIRYYHLNPKNNFLRKQSQWNLLYLTLANSIRAIVTAIRTICFTRTNLKYKSNWDKVGCIFPIVINSLLPHAEFGLNYHQEDASHFIILGCYS